MTNELQRPAISNGAALAPDATAGEVPLAPERSAATLVTGIIADAQHLIGQQMTLFRLEIQDELRKGLYAAIALAVGVGISIVGGVLLLVMLPLLLHWSVPELPLWACFGILGGVFTVVGGVFGFVAVRKLRSCSPLSNPAVAALKENLMWTTAHRQ